MSTASTTATAAAASSTGAGKGKVVVLVAGGVLLGLSAFLLLRGRNSRGTAASTATTDPSQDQARQQLAIRSVIELLKSPATASRGLDIVIQLTASSDNITDFYEADGMGVLVPLLQDETPAIRLKANWAVANLCFDPKLGLQLLNLGQVGSVLQEASQLVGSGALSEVQEQISSCAMQTLLNLSAGTTTIGPLIEREGEALLALLLRLVREGSKKVRWEGLKILTNISSEVTQRNALADFGLIELLAELLEEGSAPQTEDKALRVRVLQILCNMIASPLCLVSLQSSERLQAQLKELAARDQSLDEESREFAKLLLSRCTALQSPWDKKEE